MKRQIPSPADLPRRQDQSAEEHARLAKRIREIEQLDDIAISKIRELARHALMDALPSKNTEMTIEDRTTLVATARRLRNPSRTCRPNARSNLDGVDTTLARMGRKYSLHEVSDDLDAGRLVSGHREIVKNATRRDEQASDPLA